MQVQLQKREAMDSMGVTGSARFFFLELWPDVFLHNTLTVGGPMWLPIPGGAGCGPPRSTQNADWLSQV